MKKIFLLICCSVSLLKLSAQVAENHAQRFGIKAGVQYNIMNFNAGSPPPAMAVKNTWKPGLYIGGSLQFPLDEIFAIQPEYMYSLMQGADDRIKTNYRLHYLSLPVLLRIAPAEKFAVVAGPSFNMLIHASEPGADITHDTEERSVSAIAGLELKVTRALIFEARYVHGLNHIGLGQRSVVREFKWRGMEAGLAWKW